MNKLILLFILTILPVISFGMDADNAHSVYMTSDFHIPPEKLSQMELNAYDGDAQAAYQLGRYYQYCLGTEYDMKVACVYYYMARCFGHLGAYLQLNDILFKSSGCKKFPHGYEAFGKFTKQELHDLNSHPALLSNFILYHNSQLNGMHESAEKYGALLYGKVSPRFLRNFEEIEKNYPILVPLSRPHIEADEIPIFERLALMGDKERAARLMAYYRFSNPEEKRNAYLRDLWAYISYMLGHSESKSILEFHYKKPISELFVEIKESGIIRKGDSKDDMLYDFVMLNYSRIKKDKQSEQHYYNELKSKGIDERLVNNSVN